MLTCCPAMVTLGASASAAPPPPPLFPPPISVPMPTAAAGDGHLHHLLVLDGIQKFGGGLETVLRLDGKALQNGVVQPFRRLDARLGDGHKSVRVVQPLQRLRGQKARQGGVKTGTAQEYTSVYGPWRPRRMYCSLGA